MCSGDTHHYSLPAARARIISAYALTLKNDRCVQRGRGSRVAEKMATQSGSASVEECEEYIEKHGIQGLLKECIAKICQEQPPNPYKWLAAYFTALDTKKVATPRSPTPDVCNDARASRVQFLSRMWSV